MVYGAGRDISISELFNEVKSGFIFAVYLCGFFFFNKDEVNIFLDGWREKWEEFREIWFSFHPQNIFILISFPPL